MKVFKKTRIDIWVQINGVDHTLTNCDNEEDAITCEDRAKTTQDILESVLLPSNYGIGEFQDVYEILESTYG